jgi:hypothetical protein
VDRETIIALRDLRTLAVEQGGRLGEVVDELDNAGVFERVDDEADYSEIPIIG